MITEYSLSSITMATPETVKGDVSLKISNGRIKEFKKSSQNDFTIGDGYFLFPALINIHDHLFGTYYPKIGNGPYICWLPWDYDLKSSPIYEERNKNSAYEIYLLGSYKNLISGVTTVQDHIPHKVNDPFIEKLPIRVIKDYSLSHEVSVYDLKWGDGIDVEYKKAVENDIPYITHVEEGFDVESLKGIEILEEHGALSEYTILIHGIGFNENDIKLVAKRKANFVWCPGSNMFMFNRTAKIKDILKEGINVSIGTDSPSSGEINILEEIRFAKKVYYEMYGEELDDKEVVRMITVNPAKALRIQKDLGSIEKGKKADLLLISKTYDNPYSSLVNAKLSDIALVIMEGKPIYGDENFAQLFNALEVDHERITVDSKNKLIVGSPTKLMNDIWKNIGYKKKLPFLPIQ
ncbi:MAG: hydrolase [Spirochaetes bacterium]|nr:MAG: hydrolase [Spirochaetota bacterium]